MAIHRYTIGRWWSTLLGYTAEYESMLLPYSCRVSYTLGGGSTHTPSCRWWYILWDRMLLSVGYYTEVGMPNH
jgi:hypothetical protein